VEIIGRQFESGRAKIFLKAVQLCGSGDRIVVERASAVVTDNEHEPANFIFAKSYLGVEHTGDLVIIQITFNEGRTTSQKQALYKAIAEGIHVKTGIGIGDVFINLVEVKRENWSFGNGVAQYAAT
jgi:phenylpyruvate tautomerase PptA (4-oxalocrotonate tautomerase family)